MLFFLSHMLAIFITMTITTPAAIFSFRLFFFLLDVAAHKIYCRNTTSDRKAYKQTMKKIGGNNELIKEKLYEKKKRKKKHRK